jgi:hypothetical protein
VIRRRSPGSLVLGADGGVSASGTPGGSVIRCGR